MKFISIKKISPEESSKVRIILAASVILIYLTAVFYPLDLLSRYVPGIFREDSSCIMLNVTGLPCPFCGMSRAFHEYISLNFSKSIYYNPFSVIFFTFSGLFCLAIFVLSLFNYKFEIRTDSKSLTLFLLLLFVIWIANIYYGHH